MATAARQPGMDDRLSYGTFLSPTTLELRDKSFFAAFTYEGPDQEYHSHEEMADFADRLSEALKRVGQNGCMFNFDSIRYESPTPPMGGSFPEPTSFILNEERETEYGQRGQHYETVHFLGVTYRPPSVVKRQFSKYFLGSKLPLTRKPRAELLQAFERRVRAIQDTLMPLLKLTPLGEAAIERYLHACLTEIDSPIGVHPTEEVSETISSQDFHISKRRIGAMHTRTIGITGWPLGTAPQMLGGLLDLPYSLRLSSRFIAFDAQTATQVLTNLRNDWRQLYMFAPMNLIKRHIGEDEKREQEKFANTDAQEQSQGVHQAINMARSGQWKYGYWTQVLVLRDENREIVDLRAREIIQRLQMAGFTSDIETRNAAEAFAGSLPGHGAYNVRKPPVDTRHIAQLIPASSKWAGSEFAPNTFYPPKSPPLMIVTTSGQEPFRLNLHIGTTGKGHTMTCGPTGAGKTTLLGALCLAQLRYPEMRIRCFGRDDAEFIYTMAAGGQFLDASILQHAPLAYADEQDERTWLEDWLCQMLLLLNHTPTPLGRLAIRQGLERIGGLPRHMRTMTILHGQIQTQEVGLKEALSFYTLGSPGGAFLDGTPTAQEERCHWVTYEMEKLLGKGLAISSPTLLWMFHDLERELDGRPMFVPIAEGWQIIADKLFEERVEEWPVTLRKKNAHLLFEVHNPTDLDMMKSRGRFISSIATTFYLRNPKATDEDNAPQYSRLGLRRREIETIAKLPDFHYYMRNEEDQARVINLRLGPWALAFLGFNGRDHKEEILELQQKEGDGWPAVWLERHGQPGGAARWLETYQQWKGVRHAA